MNKYRIPQKLMDNDPIYKWIQAFKYLRLSHLQLRILPLLTPNFAKHPLINFLVLGSCKTMHLWIKLVS